MQLENIEKIENRLWKSADTLRSNSNYASNEYFMPVMGLIFLRHAYSRYLSVKPEIEASLPSRSGVIRQLTKEDFSRKGAIFLRPKAQFDYLVGLTDADDRVQAIITAMETIEKDYKNLADALPKAEYRELDSKVLGTLFRAFNDPALKNATGDIFGRIYEYFLTKFADQKAHDGGEFFTPASLVQMLVNVIEPDHGDVIDPACGSGGMFVQSAHFIEQMHKSPQDVATFYGMEKNPTTIRLAMMNLAVHGLEGKISKAISYYEDPHEMFGKADFVMANPPFNVDNVDAEKIKNDPRLPFGLPGVNDEKKISNGNYLWISYFYSYLKDKGRAGFVMSSQASSAGGAEAKIRQKLIETGHVDAMVTIRSNFFYTRTVPCELWFLNKDKPAEHKDKVLMLDARNIFRKVTSKIYDFSPEQLQNLSSIVWLYRGQRECFLDLVESYLEKVIADAKDSTDLIIGFLDALEKLLSDQSSTDELKSAIQLLKDDADNYAKQIKEVEGNWKNSARDHEGLLEGAEMCQPLAEISSDLFQQFDPLYKLTENLLKEAGTKGIIKPLNTLGVLKKNAVEQLKRVGYFYKQALWLQKRFPDAELRDVKGLVKLVDHAELKDNDWSLTPGRYVGVAPEEDGEDFDFKGVLADIHLELKGLNEEAAILAAKIQKHFEELGT